MRRALDFAGVALVGAAILWTITGAHGRGDHPGPVVLGFLLVTACYATSRFVSSRCGAEVVASAVIAVGAIDLLGLPLIRYQNASRALGVQACLAAVLVVVSATDRSARRLALGAAALLALSIVVGRSEFAILSLAIPIGLLALAGATRRPLFVATLGAIAVALIVGFTALPRPPEADRFRSLTVRAALWDEAREILADHPLTGVGPGRFEEVQQVSRDPDLRFAHSALLQQGAEQGYIGIALLVAIVGWAFVRGALAETGSLVPAVGAASLTALSLHASLDFILHFPLVFACAAVLVGAATADQPAARATTRA